MIDAFYTAAVGVNTIQKGMDIVANNTANVSTDGFKRGETSFADLVYTNIQASDVDTKLKYGHGSKVNKIDTIHKQSSLRQTDRNLDYAITDDGYFAIEQGDEIKYTRSGSFHISIEGEEMYVVNANNGYVLDADGERITVTRTDETIQPGVYVFQNNDGLLIEEGLYFNETAESGEPEANTEALVKHGFLELSNVDMAQTMSDMILFQRAFQFNSKLVQTADEVMQTVNALRQ